MRLRWTLVLAFVALSVVQIAVVVPLALRNLSSLLSGRWWPPGSSCQAPRAW